MLLCAPLLCAACCGREYAGTEPNIIPAISKSRWYIRAPTMEDIKELHDKVEGCMKAVRTYAMIRSE